MNLCSYECTRIGEFCFNLAFFKESKLVQAELQEMVIQADALINMLENGLHVIPVTLLIHI